MGEHIVQRFVGCVIVSLCLAASASAVMLQEGTQEIQVQGNLDFENAGGDTAMDLALGWGYYITDYVEVGVKGGLFLSDAADSYRLGGFGEYHFDIETILVPYMGGGLALLTTDINNGDNTTALIVNGAAGLKLYLVENVALSFQTLLELATDDIYIADGKLKNWDLTLELGLRFYY
ncbi:MAG: porin family protein [Verrucomicrobia bacterium]|nr:porin family protein [Verrucomicrobiota bacterium]